jgi:hypothetical protein
MDIEAITLDGLIIVGELKTTEPYQPGFGAQQRTMIMKDLDRCKARRLPFAGCLAGVCKAVGRHFRVGAAAGKAV